MNPLTCHAAVHAASDQLTGLLPDAERGVLGDHLAGCESCSCLMDQLRSTVAVLGSRPEVAYGAVVDAALAELDPLDAALVTLIDIDGARLGQAVLELDLPSGEARDRPRTSPQAAPMLGEVPVEAGVHARNGGCSRRLGSASAGPLRVHRRRPRSPRT